MTKREASRFCAHAQKHALVIIIFYYSSSHFSKLVSRRDLVQSLFESLAAKDPRKFVRIQKFAAVPLRRRSTKKS